MRKCLYAVLAAVLLLCGCAPVRPPDSPSAETADTSAASTQISADTPSMPPERTPDPSDEMLVTGSVTAVLDNAIQIKSDNLEMDLEITMLDRAEYADGVSKEFKAGNYVRIITSNKMAKTVPERTAARTVLENSGK